MRRDFSFCMPAEFGQIIHVTSYSSSASEIVSSVLTVPDDISGILSVRKVVLFGISIDSVLDVVRKETESHCLIQSQCIPFTMMSRFGGS